MGTVYRATHLALDHVVALKVISADLASDDTFRERFRSEIQGRRLAPPSQRRADPPRGRGGRAALRDDGPDRRPRPAPHADLRRRARARPRDAADRPGRLGARRRPLARARPSRHQARQRPRRATGGGRSRLPDRLRPRQAIRPGDPGQRPDRHRGVRRHARLRRARADPRRTGRRSHRRLRARLRPLRGRSPAAPRSPSARRTSPRSTPTSRTSRPGCPATRSATSTR